jgi:PDZ domain-containing protein
MKVIVNRVLPDAPAQGQLQPGDVIVSVNGRAVSGAEQVREALGDTRPGQVVEISYQRSAATSTAQITLGSRDDRESGFLGIEPANQPDVPFDITISLADVGGPSAGLMFALAIVDKLTPGELNGGRFVAGTGEITSDGQVGPIGGIPFKMTAAREAGATVFLVPADNCLEAKQRAPEGLRLVKVETLTDAVQALESLSRGGDAPACG